MKSGMLRPLPVGAGSRASARIRLLEGNVDGRLSRLPIALQIPQDCIGQLINAPKIAR